MKTPNIDNKVIFHDWQPRELQALIRATALLHAKQPKEEPERAPVLRAKHLARRRKP